MVLSVRDRLCFILFLLRLKHWQLELHADLVVELHQIIEECFIRVQLAPGLQRYSVDDEMGVDMLTVGVGADQHLPILKEFRQPSRRKVCLRWVDFLSLGKALHQMVEPSAAIFVVEQLGAEEIVVGAAGLTVDSADQLHITPTGFLILGGVTHHSGHAASALSFGAFHKIGDGYAFHLPRSCRSRSTALMFESS